MMLSMLMVPVLMVLVQVPPVTSNSFILFLYSDAQNHAEDSEWDNPLLWPAAWCTPGQGLPSWLLGYCWLIFNQDPQLSFHRAALQPLISHYVHTSRFVLSQVQPGTFVKLHTVGDCPAFWFVKISLQGFSAFRGANSSSQFFVVGKHT